MTFSLKKILTSYRLGINNSYRAIMMMVIFCGIQLMMKPTFAAATNTRAVSVQFQVPVKFMGYTSQNAPRRLTIKCYVTRQIGGSMRLLGEKGLTKTINPNVSTTITVPVKARSGQYFQKGDDYQCNQVNRISGIDTFRSVLKVKGKL